MKKREYIGLKDKNGRKIYVDNEVVFYFDADMGHSLKPDKRYTKMTDLVRKIGGEYYFWDRDINCGAFAWQHNEFCHVLKKKKTEK